VLFRSINFGGVGVEARRLADRLDDTLQNSKRMTALFLRERFTMSLSGEVVSQTLTACLIQLPVISPNHRLKVALSATEAARMQANADMLSEMTFNGQLIRNLQMQIGHVSRLGRSLMQMAGNAIRIAELLDLVQQAEEEGRPVTENDVAALYFKDVNVETPTGVRLVDNLSLTVTKGQSLVVCGANGVGKTSIFRTLKGLWGTAGGEVAYPKSTLFLPQTPYCPLGSLQDLQSRFALGSALVAAQQRPDPVDGTLDKCRLVHERQLDGAAEHGRGGAAPRACCRHRSRRRQRRGSRLYQPRQRDRGRKLPARRTEVGTHCIRNPHRRPQCGSFGA
jgi:energy-coupling factor transporter ATP-binding protein EcfA2